MLQLIMQITALPAQSFITANRMVTFPKSKSAMKVDPMWQLQFCLRLWVQRDEFMSVCLIILSVKLLVICARIIVIFHSLGDMEVLLEISATFSIPLLAATKMTFLLVQRKKIRFLFSGVREKFWDMSLAGPRMHTYLSKRFKLVNFFLLGHFLVGIFCVVLHMLYAEVPIPEGRTRWLPTLISLPFDQDTSPLYEILYVILTWNIFLTVVGSAFFDFLFIYGSQQLSGQFMLVKELLRRLDEGLMEHCEDVEKFKSNRFQKKVFQRTAICVKHHNFLLRYGNELKNLTSLIFGLQLLTTFLTLVLCGFMMLKNFAKVTKSTMLLMMVSSLTAQLSLFAVQSADLQSQSASVASAAYQSKWYLFNAQIKRSLTLLIMNSQKGISMNGARLTTMDNEIIVNMGHKVFSFITLLRSLDE